MPKTELPVRDVGPYWVKYRGQWIIAKWTHMHYLGWAKPKAWWKFWTCTDEVYEYHWRMFNDTGAHNDDEFQKIGPPITAQVRDLEMHQNPLKIR